MYIARYIHHFKVLLTIHYDVELSLFSGVDGCVYPNYINMRLIVLPILVIFNNLPNSDSYSYAATSLIMIHMVYILPLSLIGSVLLSILPDK